MRAAAADAAGAMPPHLATDETLTILWLEDLTGAEAPPFGVGQLREMARHLGKWNADGREPTAARLPDRQRLPAEVRRRLQLPDARADLLELRDEPMVREMFARHPVEIAGAYISVYLELVERSKTLPHALALADCPISNFFHLPGETIAIDWAGLGSEPLGADGGRFIGSALTWGRASQRSPGVSESCSKLPGGLREGGATEDRAVLRSGYLSELGYYLAFLVTLPSILVRPKAGLSIEYFEKRLTTARRRSSAQRCRYGRPDPVLRRRVPRPARSDHA